MLTVDGIRRLTRSSLEKSFVEMDQIDMKIRIVLLVLFIGSISGEVSEVSII